MAANALRGEVEIELADGQVHVLRLTNDALVCLEGVREDLTRLRAEVIGALSVVPAEAKEAALLGVVSAFRRHQGEGITLRTLGEQWLNWRASLHPALLWAGLLHTGEDRSVADCQVLLEGLLPSYVAKKLRAMLVTALDDSAPAEVRAATLAASETPVEEAGTSPLPDGTGGGSSGEPTTPDSTAQPSGA